MTQRERRGRTLEAIETLAIIIPAVGALFFVGSVLVFIVQLVRYALMPRL